MRLTHVTGPGCHWMCAGPLCFHGFKYGEQVFAMRGYKSRVTNYVCLAWGEMIPN
jgi:hypothetical protein